MWLICLLGCKAVSARERQIPNSKLHPEVSYTGTLIIVEEWHGKKAFCLLCPKRDQHQFSHHTLNRLRGRLWELAKWLSKGKCCDL